MLSKITKVVRVKVIDDDIGDGDDDDLKLLTVTLSKDGWTKPQVSSSIFMAATSRPWLAHMQIQIQNSTRYRITRTQQNMYYEVFNGSGWGGWWKWWYSMLSRPRMPCHQFVTAVQCAHLYMYRCTLRAHTFLSLPFHVLNKCKIVQLTLCIHIYILHPSRP